MLPEKLLFQIYFIEKNISKIAPTKRNFLNCFLTQNSFFKVAFFLNCSLKKYASKIASWKNTFSKLLFFQTFSLLPPQKKNFFNLLHLKVLFSKLVRQKTIFQKQLIQNLHFRNCFNKIACSKNTFAKLLIKKNQVTATVLEPRTTQFVNQYSTIWPNWSPVEVT